MTINFVTWEDKISTSGRPCKNHVSFIQSHIVRNKFNLCRNVLDHGACISILLLFSINEKFKHQIMWISDSFSLNKVWNSSIIVSAFEKTPRSSIFSKHATQCAIIKIISNKIVANVVHGIFFGDITTCFANNQTQFTLECYLS